MGGSCSRGLAPKNLRAAERERALQAVLDDSFGPSSVDADAWTCHEQERQRAEKEEMEQLVYEQTVQCVETWLSRARTGALSPVPECDVVWEGEGADPATRNGTPGALGRSTAVNLCAGGANSIS